MYVNLEIILGKLDNPQDQIDIFSSKYGVEFSAFFGVQPKQPTKLEKLIYTLNCWSIIQIFTSFDEVICAENSVSRNRLRTPLDSRSNTQTLAENFHANLITIDL